MRRILGPIALFLGVALLLAGVLAKPMLGSKLSKVPLNYDQVVISEGQMSKVLRVWGDQTVGQHFDVMSDQLLRNTRTVKGIPAQVPADKRDTNAFWQLGLNSQIIPADGSQPLQLSSSVDGVSFDRTTAESTNCCGDTRSAGDLADPTKTLTDDAGQHSGLFFKFPFGAEQKTYPFWDGRLGKAVDANFVRTDTIKGMQTNVYEQKINEKIDVGSLPARMFGQTGDNVKATETYQNTRTLWVDPVTGVILKGQEELNRVISSGLGDVPAVVGTIAYTDASQQALVDKYKEDSSKLGFLTGPFVPLSLISGLLLIGLGLALLFARGRRSDDAADGERVDDLYARAATASTPAAATPTHTGATRVGPAAPAPTRHVDTTRPVDAPRPTDRDGGSSDLR